jgi:hypothetical protein
MARVAVDVAALSLSHKRVLGSAVEVATLSLSQRRILGSAASQMANQARQIERIVTRGGQTNVNKTAEAAVHCCFLLPNADAEDLSIQVRQIQIEDRAKTTSK